MEMEREKKREGERESVNYERRKSIMELLSCIGSLKIRLFQRLPGGQSLTVSQLVRSCQMAQV